MRKINFLFGVHNHQPVGNFDFILEEAYSKAYFPFIDTLERFPSIKVTFHFSGFLLNWISDRYPEYLVKLKKMVQTGQVELFTGGYYEPILPIIPDEDKINQIKKLTSFISNYFNINPRGIWLAERVWEPQIPSSLFKTGIEYTALDDNHFKSAGHYNDELKGYFITEDQGIPLKVFPINTQLRYLIPFSEPEKTIEFLREKATEGGENMYLMFDDGEKFGIWPGTHDIVYRGKWMERFFTLLCKNSEWIKTVTFNEFADNHKPVGRTYIPSSAYSEMMIWSMPSRSRSHFEKLESELKQQNQFERFSMFLKTGFWRTFLSKYTEANLMHKKMLHVRGKYENKMPDSILEEIYKAQGNDVLWHGVFGGLYLPHLRSAIYSSLIKAEKAIDDFKHDNQDFIEVTEKDLDVDGNKEILINTKKFTIGISPEVGGRIFEISVKDRNINLVNTLTRRYEPYHEAMSNALTAEEGGKGSLLVKEKGLEKFLNYDWYERFSLLDHFFGEWNDLEKYSKCRYPEQGDFTTQRYSYQITGRDTGEVKLWRRGHVWAGSVWAPVKVEKTLQIEDDGIYIIHIITNESNEPLSIVFGTEFNINLLAPNSNDRFFYCPEFEKKTLGEAGRVKATFFGARSEYEGIDILFQPDREVEFFFFPVYTVSYSENGYEKVYQASSITPVHRFQVKPMASFQTELKIKIQNI